MIPLHFSVLARLLQGTLVGSDQYIQSVTTDSRSRLTTPGTLFIALPGDRFDGHQFAAQAVARGVQALLVEQPLPLAISQVIVPSTYQALRQLASWVRQHASARRVAVTGSNGKSSVKEMTASILQQRGETLATFKNHNNQLGVPLTLLRLTDQHRFAVLELAASAPGEIARNSALVQPEAALINNISEAHLVGFGSLAGVAQAKGEIFTQLTADGIAIVMLESHDLPHWQSQLTAQQTLWRCALQATPGANFYASAIQQHPGGGCEFLLHSPKGTILISLLLLGRHNVANAVAAAALAMAVGAELSEIQQGLAACQPIAGRLYPQWLAPDQLLIDDSYNANVASMLAAIQVLEQQPGYRCLVVGDMAELGDRSAACHQQVALALAATSIEQVFSVGSWSELISRAAGGTHCPDQATLIASLKVQRQQRWPLTILVKGSRGAAMERVVAALQEESAC
jgi:UDP-N-acetylmuramoyl-tripeptide--D-alanyl-D-alanine ligase